MALWYRVLFVGLLLGAVPQAIEAQQKKPAEPASAFEKDLFAIEGELQTLEEETSGVEGRYLAPFTVSREYHESPAKKMEKADFYFQRKDYVSAGSLYYSIVSSRKEKDVIWEEAQFKLAETLFLSNNYISASRYYDLLLAEKPYSRFQVDALKRLIAAAYHLGEHAKAKSYYKNFLDIGYDISRDQDLLYFLGKSLFFDAQYKDAEKVFSAVKKGSTYYLQALYFQGVIALQGKDLDRALSFFSQVTDAPAGTYFKYEQIRDLAVLAVGRLLFEKGDLVAATDYYLRVDHRSHLFAEAYLELCWIYIKREQWEKALEALRLVRYIAPGSFVAPQAEILEGNILIKLRRYGEAMLLFNRVVKEYGNIREQLNALKGKGTTLWEDTRTSAESHFSLYAPLVRSLLRDNKKFSQAMRLQDDLRQIETELDQVTKLERKLGSVIENKNAAAVFPPLRKGTEVAVSLRNRLTSLREALVKACAGEASKVFSPRDRAKWEKLEEERKSLEKNLREVIPQSGNTIGETFSRYAVSVLAFEEEIHRALLRTKAFDDQLSALHVSYMRTVTSLDDRTVKKIENEQRQVALLREQLLRLQEETEDEKNRLLLGGDMYSRIIIARDAYERVLVEQESLLSRLAPSVMRQGRVESLFARLNTLAGTLDRFSDKLNEVVGGLIQNIKDSFESEKIKVEEYKSQLLSLKREVGETASLAMFANLSRLNKTFDDLLLQADLGIIDVAWERKEEATQNLNRLRMRMAQEIQDLNLNLENLE